MSVCSDKPCEKNAMKKLSWFHDGLPPTVQPMLLQENQITSNFRKFKEKMISQTATGNANKLSDNHMEELCEKIKVGDRCEVEPGEKRGVVKFVGKAETVAPGYWVGIQLDEPLGKHDGMVKGKKYFDCLPQHGLLLRPDKVKVGDYPERDPFDEEEI